MLILYKRIKIEIPSGNYKDDFKISYSMKMNKWKLSNEKLKEKEIEKLLEAYKLEGLFKSCLVLGAGNGSQTKYLKKLAGAILATDINEERLLSESSIDSTEKMVLNAEECGEILRGRKFDLVFSSNLLEHLPNPSRCLEGTKIISNNDTVHIHIVPNHWWRILSIILYYPVKIRNIVRGSRAKVSWNNNQLKKEKFQISWVMKLFPQPHGVSENAFIEIFEFSNRHWESLFERNGFTVIQKIKGPISSGYGIGFNKLKHIAEKLGFSTETIYILTHL